MALRTKKPAAAPARVPFTGEAQQALADVEDELAALAAGDLLYVNVDVSRSVSIVLGAEPQIATYAAQIEEHLPSHDVSGLSRLRTYALAALFANVQAQPRAKRGEVTELVAKGTALKQRLIVSAEALAYEGLVDAGQLAEIKSGHGHLDLASDLVALAALFHLSWEQVKEKTFIAYSDLEDASRIGTALLGALGARNHAASRVAPEVLERKHRAFTLLFRAYDEARRALSYLRYHEDDVEEIAPSLYKRPKKRAATVVEEEAEENGEAEDIEEVEAAEEEAGDGREAGAPAALHREAQTSNVAEADAWPASGSRLPMSVAG